MILYYTFNEENFTYMITLQERDNAIYQIIANMTKQPFDSVKAILSALDLENYLVTDLLGDIMEYFYNDAYESYRSEVL